MVILKYKSKYKSIKSLLKYLTKKITFTQFSHTHTHTISQDKTCSSAGQEDKSFSATASRPRRSALTVSTPVLREGTMARVFAVALMQPPSHPGIRDSDLQVSLQLHAWNRDPNQHLQPVLQEVCREEVVARWPGCSTS